MDVRCAILLRDQPSELDAVKYSLATVNEVVLKISRNVSLQNKCHFREVHLYAFFVAVQSTFRRMDVRCPFRTSAVNAACWKRGAARHEPQILAVASSLPVRMERPSGKTATARTLPEWPVRVRRGSQVATSVARRRAMEAKRSARRMAFLRLCPEP